MSTVYAIAFDLIAVILLVNSHVKEQMVASGIASFWYFVLLFAIGILGAGVGHTLARRR